MVLHLIFILQFVSAVLNSVGIGNVLPVSPGTGNASNLIPVSAAIQSSQCCFWTGKGYISYINALMYLAARCWFWSTAKSNKCYWQTRCKSNTIWSCFRCSVRSYSWFISFHTSFVTEAFYSTYGGVQYGCWKLLISFYWREFQICYVNKSSFW